ncbi:MAG: F0F1 ATP synthase subunit B [Bacteroidales bacterium]|jgi:F-type H+-transporting ATPase subunit b|nr:F0F1 ATP synthase subunit B [Bacteroidales bacterium]
MELITPEFGLLFWMFLAFFLVFFILKRYAWKPILNALKDREDSIRESLRLADKTKTDMELLQSENEKKIVQMQKEKEGILQEARSIREKIIEESRMKAVKERNEMMLATRNEIQVEKDKALKELKDSAADLALLIAEKILKQKLSEEDARKALLNKELNDLSLK